MDFLTAALYCDTPGEESSLRGVLLTNFDDSSDVSRARVHYVTAEQLRQQLGNEIKPAGFTLSPDGVLLSDTKRRCALDEDIADYAEQLSFGTNRTLGLIDLVLHGAEAGASVVANYDEWVEGAQAILIPFKNFRVSDSSFNIYAPYRNSEDKFRTWSLVDIQTDEVAPIYLLISDQDLGTLEPVSSLLARCHEAPVRDGEVCFMAHPKLLAAASLTGEAFCNYLAFHVAFYRMGLKIISQFLEEAKYVPAEQEDAAFYERKQPLHNVSIVCGLKRIYTSKVLELLNDEAALQDFCSRVPEALMTKTWLDNIIYNQRNVQCSADEDRLVASCVNLRSECKRKLLHFSLELLAQRLHLCQLGPMDDPIGPTLYGGGVIGCSIKRATW